MIPASPTRPGSLPPTTGSTSSSAPGCMRCCCTCCWFSYGLVWGFRYELEPYVLFLRVRAARRSRTSAPGVAGGAVGGQCAYCIHNRRMRAHCASLAWGPVLTHCASLAWAPVRAHCASLAWAPFTMGGWAHTALRWREHQVRALTCSRRSRRIGHTAIADTHSSSLPGAPLSVRGCEWVIVYPSSSCLWSDRLRVYAPHVTGRNP